MWFCQISVGYFIADLGMICWRYPLLGGAEYVSKTTRIKKEVKFSVFLHYDGLFYETVPPFCSRNARQDMLTLKTLFFWISDSPSLAFSNCSSIFHVYRGGTALHVYGPDIWGNNPGDQLEMVSIQNVTRDKSWRNSILIWLMNLSTICTGILMYLDWRNPMHIWSMESWYFLVGWYVILRLFAPLLCCFDDLWCLLQF